jgi:hypothetical protein
MTSSSVNMCRTYGSAFFDAFYYKNQIPNYLELILDTIDEPDDNRMKLFHSLSETVKKSKLNSKV